MEAAYVLSDGPKPATYFGIRRYYMPILKDHTFEIERMARIVGAGGGKISKRTRKDIRKTKMDLRFSDQADVLAALAVSEHTDNETLISARENFILAAKMVDTDKFNEVGDLYKAGNAVTVIRPQQMIDRFISAYSTFHGEYREGPWARLGRMFKR